MRLATARDPLELRALIEAGAYRPSPEQIADAMLARAELARLLRGGARLRPADRSRSREASVLRAP